MIFEYDLIFRWPQSWPAADLPQLFQPSSQSILISLGWRKRVTIYTDYEGAGNDGISGAIACSSCTEILLKNQFLKISRREEADPSKFFSIWLFNYTVTSILKN